MGILKVKKVNIIGHIDRKQDILSRLQESGIMQIDDIHDHVSQEVIERFETVQDYTSEQNIRFHKVKFLVNLLEPYKDKEGFFEKLNKPIKQFTVSEIEKQAREFEIANVYREFKELHSEIDRMRSEIDKLDIENERLYPWKDLPCSFDDIKNLAQVTVMLIKAEVQDYDFLIRVISEDKLVVIQNVHSDSKYIFFLLAFHNSLTDMIKPELAKFEIDTFSYENLPGGPGNIIEENKSRINELAKTLRQEESLIASGVKHLEKLYVLYDYYKILEDRNETEKDLGVTENVFAISGWCAERESKKLTKTVLKDNVEDIDLTIRDAEKDERPPIILSNKNIFTPFEFITNLYGSPHYNELDPTPYFSLFFVFFFGFCLTDAGYGIVAFILSAAILLNKKWAKKLKGAVPLLKVIFLSSIATIIMGALTGGFFGIDFSNTPLSSYILINPLGERGSILLIKIAIYIGIIQVTFGYIVNLFKEYKRDGILTALSNNLPWIIIIPSASIALGSLLGLKLDVTVPLILFFLAELWVILFHGMPSSNFIKRIMKGIYSGFFGLTGILGDVLSYLRLFALGLATGILAVVVNTIVKSVIELTSSNPVLQVVGFVLGFVILVLGHTGNLVINALGSFIHTMRLQFVEFFQKFFEGGGEKFSPFEIKTEHIIIKE